jgi:carboxylesterase
MTVLANIVNPHLEGDSFYWPAGPTGVLLAHGFCATTAEVRPLAGLLHQQGYTVAGPLLPGHKTTPETISRCRWQDWANALDSAYDHLAARCEQVLVGGESMGGLLALHLASRRSRVAGILTFAPAVRIPFGRRIGAALLGPLGTLFGPRPRPTPVDKCWQGYTARPARAAIELYRLMREVNRRFGDIRQPLLIVQGRLDASIDPAGAETLYARVGSQIKELHWMEKSTHCVILDQELPHVAQVTLKFIDRVAPRNTGHAPEGVP